jgi:acetyltransferase
MSRDLRSLFFPKSVVVVGASRSPGSLGGAVLSNIVEGGFGGAVYAVHPSESEVAGIRAHKDLDSLPEAPELAALAVPPELVEWGIPRLLDRGTRAFVVHTAGFGELDADGREREQALVEMCREHDAVMLGPNCLGFHVSTLDSRLDMSFSRVRPESGGTILLSQSGSITEWLMVEMAERGLGTTLAINPGNMADLELADLLEGALLHFPTAKHILIYLETAPEPARFQSAAATLPDTGRLVILGGGAMGGGILAGLGAASVDSGTEALDVLETMDRLGDPRGKRVAVVTNAGGPATLVADELRRAGMEVPPLSSDLVTRLRKGIAPAAITGNPVDLLATAQPEAFRHALHEISSSYEVDALVAVFMHPVMTEGAGLAAVFRETLPGCPRPGLVCWLGTSEEIPGLRQSGVAVIPEPTRAAKALAAWSLAS